MILTKKKEILSTKSMILSALFVALIAIGAFIKVPVPVCPFTLQLLFTTLAGLLLGANLGFVSICVYIISANVWLSNWFCLWCLCRWLSHSKSH